MLRKKRKHNDAHREGGEQGDEIGRKFRQEKTEGVNFKC